MRKATIGEKKKCPICGQIDDQVKTDITVRERRPIVADFATNITHRIPNGMNIAKKSNNKL